MRTRFFARGLLARTYPVFDFADRAQQFLAEESHRPIRIQLRQRRIMQIRIVYPEYYTGLVISGNQLHLMIRQNAHQEELLTVFAIALARSFFYDFGLMPYIKIPRKHEKLGISFIQTFSSGWIAENADRDLRRELHELMQVSAAVA